MSDTAGSWRQFGSGPLSRATARVYTLLVVEALLVLTTLPGAVPLLLLDRDASNLPLYALCALPVGPAVAAGLWTLRHQPLDLTDLRPAAVFWRGYRTNLVPVLRVWLPVLLLLTVEAVNLTHLAVAGVPDWWAVPLIVLAVVVTLGGVNALVITSLFAFRTRDVARLALYFLLRTPQVPLGSALLLLAAGTVTAVASEAVAALFGAVFVLALLRVAGPMIDAIGRSSPREPAQHGEDTVRRGLQPGTVARAGVGGRLPAVRTRGRGAAGGTVSGGFPEPAGLPGQAGTTTDGGQPVPVTERTAHPAWLPPAAFRPLGSRRVLVHGDGLLVDTVLDEVVRACLEHGGRVWRSPTWDVEVDLVLALRDAGPLANATAEATRLGVTPAADGAAHGRLADEEFLLTRTDGVTVVLADTPAGLLYGLFHTVRLGAAAFDDDRAPERHRPALHLRALDHWDNVEVHPVSGQVERGYAGGSIFWRDGAARDLTRVREYRRLLAAVGINAVTVNNVNVHGEAARLLTDRLDDVVAIAEVLRPYGIRVHLAVSFAAPVVLGGLPTADPLDERVRAWWADATHRVYRRIPDFGGFLVKADSEGNPARSPTAGTTPTGRTCSPRHSPRTAAWCAGARSSTTITRTGGTGRPTGPGPRTTTSSRWTGGSVPT
ncbi:hypothetical protein GCM10027605_34190 [Micromonospora zhanjiangensis]